MPLAIREFATHEALMEAAASSIAAKLKDALHRRGAACAALSGGSTPAPAYRRLAGKGLDWPNITFALVDERFVPPDHAASNEGLVRRELKPAFDGGARFAPLYPQKTYPQAAPTTLNAAADMADALYRPFAFDVVLMGMGADGHTASWFPGATLLGDALEVNNPRCVIALIAAQADGSPERLTLTRAALARARHVILLIAGEDKRARLESAVAGDWAPVAALFSPSLPKPEVLWAR